MAALAAQAHAQDAGASPCAQEPVFVDTSVGGEARGGALALLPDGAVWVESRLLRESEAAYGVAEVTCDLGTFVKLSGALDVTYDPAELLLTVRPRLDLLPGNTLDLGRSAPSVPGPDATLPLFTVGAQGRVERAEPGSPLSRSLGVQGGVQTGPLSGALDVTVAAQDTEVRTEVQLNGSYEVTPRLTVGAQVFAQRQDNRLSLNNQRISGLRVRWGDQQAYRLPVWTLDLPLDAEVRVRVNGESLPPVRVRAGQLVLRNIALSVPAGTLEVTVLDANGERVEARSYGPGDVVVTARTLAVQAVAGRQGQDGAASVTGVYGVTDRWSVSGEGLWRGRDWEAQLGARYADRQINAGMNVTYRSARPEAAALTGDVTLVRDQWRLGGSVQVTPLNLRASQAGVSVGWADDGTTVSLNAQASPGQAQYRASAAVSRQVNPTLNAAVRAQVSSDAGKVGWQAGVTVTWVPRDTLTVTGAALMDGAQQTAGIEARWKPAPGHELVASGQVSSLPTRSARVGYSFTGPAAVSVAAGTDGAWSVSGRVGAAWVAGRAYLTADDPGPGVLVRVGLPGVPLLVNGARVVSDARGEALVLLAAGTRQVSVTPDFETLPVTVSVREDRRDVTLSGQGAGVVDWTGNFEAFVWVRLLGVDGAPLPYATLDLRGARRTDDEGWVLLPVFGTPQAVAVTLDGAAAAACRVTLTPGVESARCAP
ncbi:hypothetical protein GCM10008960_37230 [Deinococcus sedimenti]|uniref:Uncharacterized protein n=2 Tax=Deinococcus sedimenti TaxID=1867090 RepID=A0ABQ2S9C8_9DEIO|nr:hypothetical protein GCM10008960_37230 [Deinococcus sedimenti]